MYMCVNIEVHLKEPEFISLGTFSYNIICYKISYGYFSLTFMYKFKLIFIFVILLILANIGLNFILIKQGLYSNKQSIDLEDLWYIQLDGNIRNDITVDIYDLDLFDTPIKLINNLRNKGEIVICYFNAGVYEDWREDTDKFHPEDIGNPMDDWKGEYWLNINSENVKRIMIDRLQLAKEKGCDGVDPDNVNGYTQETGFNISYENQLEYNKFLAKEAHRLGLYVGLKNDLKQISDLVNYFDFAVNEECHQYNECDFLNPFIRVNKSVINLEYDTKYLNNPKELKKLCEDSHKRKFQTLIMSKSLNGYLVKNCNE